MASRSFHSLGETCVIVQMPPSRLRALAAANGIETTTLNGIPHYSEKDVDALFVAAGRERREIRSTIRKERR